ncbi:hypothetical protein [Geovibrio ferrireducens]|uniref:hypothetical protein n=1 Tax=Geovibrio ferrireducens TaxID=46201 RepID=UPI002245D403|nr:hypothetical protein [Geovibrio ferrireducens]
MIKGICKNCSAEFSFKAGKKTECPSCGRTYPVKKKAAKFDVMTAGETKQGLSERELLEALKNGTILETDMAATVYAPWVEIKNLFPAKKAAVKESKAYIAGYVLFIFSLLVNIILICIIYLQQEKIEILTR